MPKEKKVKKIKVVKKPIKTKQKQKQSVNVNVKIDNSRKTNPRQPNQNKNNVSRFTGNSQTPLHTTIMTATPSPAILHQEPHYAETINDMFRDAQLKTNKQLTILGQDLDDKQSQQNKLLNQLLLQNTPYNPSTVYDDLMNEHRTRHRLPAPVKTPNNFQDQNKAVPDKLTPPQTNIKLSFDDPYETPLKFEDNNGPTQSKLIPPNTEKVFTFNYTDPDEGQEETKAEQEVLQETKEDTENIKKTRGRPKLTEEEKQARENEKQRQKELTRSAKKAEKEKKQLERIKRIKVVKQSADIRQRLRNKNKIKLVFDENENKGEY